MKKLLLLLIFCSCNPIQYKSHLPISIIFYVDNTFSNSQKELIDEAAGRWEEATNYSISILIDYMDLEQDANWRTDGRSSIYNATSGWKRELALSLYKGPFWGLTMPDSGDIFITEINSQFYQLITHEIGHALMRSKEHSNNKNSVMYPLLGWDITKEDINKVLRR